MHHSSSARQQYVSRSSVDIHNFARQSLELIREKWQREDLISNLMHIVSRLYKQ